MQHSTELQVVFFNPTATDRHWPPLTATDRHWPPPRRYDARWVQFGRQRVRWNRPRGSHREELAGLGSTQWHQHSKCWCFPSFIRHYTTHFSERFRKISRMAYFLCFRFLHMIFFCLGVSCVFMTFCPHFCWIIFISRTFKQQCQVWCLLSKVSTDFIPVIMLWLEWVNGLVCGRRTVSNLRTMVFRGYIIYRTCCMGLQANW